MGTDDRYVENKRYMMEAEASVRELTEKWPEHKIILQDEDGVRFTLKISLNKPFEKDCIVVLNGLSYRAAQKYERIVDRLLEAWDERKAIGTGVFEGLGMSFVGISVTIPEGVAKIEERAFERAWGVHRIVLPDSLESIGAQAFDCTDAYINIPANVSYIGKDAFYRPSKALVDPGNKYYVIIKGKYRDTIYDRRKDDIEAIQKEIQQREQQKEKQKARTYDEMAAIAEKMGSLEDYLQNGDHWRGKWDIRDEK